MNNINIAEKYVDNEIQLLEGKVLVLKNIKLLFNSDTIKQNIPIDESLNMGIERKAPRYNIDIPETYPKNGKERSKMRFILNEFNRATSYQDFEIKINEYEQGRAKKSLETLDRTLRGLAHPRDGEWLYFNFRGSNKRFFVKPEWLTDDKQNIKQDYYPDLASINDIPQEEIVPENIVWHPSK